MKRLIGLGAVLALLAAAAIACGGDDGAVTTTSASVSASVSTPATDAPTTTGAAAADEDVVLADGRLVIPGQNVGDVDLTALPVGDDSLVDTPTVGGLHLCDTFPTDGGGAQVAGPWFSEDGATFDLTEKAFVLGEVTWDDAYFEVAVDGDDRVLTGNKLPVGHTTGEFPIADDDPAAEYDQNPSGIVENAYEIRLPAEPAEAAEPSCVGGESGVLLSGVVLNSPVDAMGRDAVAWESQDHCEGHPNPAGYHYHSVSACIPDEGTGHSDLVGYALDGYGIFGHRGEGGEVMTNADLDECHGHTHEVEVDGELVEQYHYHATWEYPYAVGCFHGEVSIQGPLDQ